jgi:hypothetical protein
MTTKRRSPKKDEGPSKQVAVRVPHELVAKLEARAAKERRSVAAMIRIILEDALVA